MNTPGRRGSPVPGHDGAGFGVGAGHAASTITDADERDVADLKRREIIEMYHGQARLLQQSLGRYERRK